MSVPVHQYKGSTIIPSITLLLFIWWSIAAKKMNVGWFSRREPISLEFSFYINAGLWCSCGENKNIVIISMKRSSVTTSSYVCLCLALHDALSTTASCVFHLSALTLQNTFGEAAGIQETSVLNRMSLKFAVFLRFLSYSSMNRSDEKRTKSNLRFF